MDGRLLTYPKLMQQQGYQTAIVGKWHLGHGGIHDPTGFDYWNVLPGQGVYVNPVFIEMGERKRHQGYVTDVITDLSMDWVRERDKSKPFLLLYHHKAPHAQWVLPGATQGLNRTLYFFQGDGLHIGYQGGQVGDDGDEPQEQGAAHGYAYDHPV